MTHHKIQNNCRTISNISIIIMITITMIMMMTMMLLMLLVTQWILDTYVYISVKLALNRPWRMYCVAKQNSELERVKGEEEKEQEQKGRGLRLISEHNKHVRGKAQLVRNSITCPWPDRINNPATCIKTRTTTYGMPNVLYPCRFITQRQTWLDQLHQWCWFRIYSHIVLYGVENVSSDALQTRW